jgi:hypothetical protein
MHFSLLLFFNENTYILLLLLTWFFERILNTIKINIIKNSNDLNQREKKCIALAKLPFLVFYFLTKQVLFIRSMTFKIKTYVVIIFTLIKYS